MCYHVTSFRIAFCGWDVIFQHLLKDHPEFKKVNPGGLLGAGSADGCLQPCPFCKSNLKVAPDTSHRFDGRMVSGSQGNVFLVYARYQCSAVGCRGERTKDAAGATRLYTSFTSHDPRVVAALPAHLSHLMLPSSHRSCWPWGARLQARPCTKLCTFSSLCICSSVLSVQGGWTLPSTLAPDGGPLLKSPSQPLPSLQIARRVVPNSYATHPTAIMTPGQTLPSRIRGLLAPRVRLTGARAALAPPRCVSETDRN